MHASVVLGLISVVLLMVSVRMFYLALNQGASERVGPFCAPGWARRLNARAWR
ncbi:hypothetical protein A245_43655 [Pseudomonas syringae pv. actinidiae ICMP 19096]|uniref:Uncharacterized protein n=1 Tax=Pseudomonas syringae pv. actinidiae ICMP 19096 TaxID=1194405 RepID=A0A656JKH4_PSESF|nr:hypothetical protein A245_43655 [Pseudomonas syringae pv. actinidiae ICMP 19096]